jgi:hypothetical protein
MENKVTHIETIRRAHAAVKLQVLNLLGWDDLRYGLFQEEQGKAYLKAIFGEGIPLVDDLPNHRAFWMWWVNHWTKRDQEFLEMSGLLFAHELEEYYRELHTPDSLVFFPHSIILEATYEAMVHKLIKEVTQ